MANDNQAQIVVDGDVSPFRQKMREAADELKRLGNEGDSVFKRMTGSLGGLHSKFIAVGAILAGGAVFREAVSASQNFHVEVDKLSKTLGVSESVALSLKMALGDLYVDSDTFNAALSKLVMTVNTAPEKFEALGISLVDSKGKSRDMLAVMMDTNSKITQFAEGTDRSRAAAYYYGKQWQDVQKILALTNERLAEGAAKAQALGINLQADDIKEYRAAMNDANDVIEALNVRIGLALIPSLKTLAVYFAEVGGPAIDKMIWALKHLIQFVDETVTALRLCWNDTKYVFDQLTTAAGQMGASMAALLQGNVSMAKDIWSEGNRQIEANEKQHLAEYERINKDHAARIIKLWEPVNSAKKGSPSSAGGNKRFTLSDKEEKPAAEKSMMQTYEAALASEKALASERNALREYSKAQELAFWQTIQQNAELSANDRIAVEKRVATLSAEVRRDAAKLKKDLDDESDRSASERALSRIDAEQAAMEALLSTDDITKKQALALEEQFEQRRYEIKRSALLSKLALYEQDPDLNPLEAARIKNQLLELEDQYQVKKNTLQGKMLLQQRQEAEKSTEIWSSLGRSFASLWDKGVTAMMNGTLRWKNATKAIGLELAGWFANSVVGAMVKSWLAGKMAEFAISMGWMTQEKAAKLGLIAAETAAQTSGSAAVVGVKVAEASAVATANAVEAGTGAAASQAPIPIIGPILAIAAMAAIFSQVSSMSSKIKSASKGFDIPKGLNPMTQLHEEEMVLPAQHANVIRGLANSGGAGGSPIALHVNAVDASSVERLFRNNGHVLAKELRRQARNFAPKNT